MAGFPSLSDNLAATMPITPGCQSSPSTTRIRSRRRLGFSRSWERAESKIPPSVSLRCSFSLQISSASSSACCSSSVIKRWTAREGSPILPVALMRGISVYATVSAESSLSSSPAIRIRARSPGRSVLFKSERPYLTRDRFSPVSGTTSPIVPRATKSA